MFKTSSIIFISILLSSCMTIQYSYDFDKNINFKKLKTYKFYDEGIAKLGLNSLDKSRMISGVESELKNKGFLKGDHPDVLVNFLVVDKERNKSSNGSLVGGYVYDYSASEFRWTNTIWSPAASVWQNTGSTIIVDLIDPVTKDLVWRGQFNGFKRDDLSRRDEKIHTMIKQILDQYPPDMQTNR